MNRQNVNKRVHSNQCVIEVSPFVVFSLGWTTEQLKFITNMHLEF